MPATIVPPPEGTPVAITSSTPFLLVTFVTLKLTNLSPGYVMGRKKRLQVGALAETPPTFELPITFDLTTAGNRFVTVDEVTQGIDPKVGVRTYKLRVRTGAVDGPITFELTITFDPELSTTNRILTPVPFPAGAAFQFPTQQQPELTVLGYSFP